MSGPHAREWYTGQEALLIELGVLMPSKMKTSEEESPFRSLKEAPAGASLFAPFSLILPQIAKGMSEKEKIVLLQQKIMAYTTMLRKRAEKKGLSLKFTMRTVTNEKDQAIGVRVWRIE